MNPGDGKKIRRKLKNHVKKMELKQIRDLIEKHGGIQFAENQINRLSDEAHNDLKIFPQSIYKDSLLSALEFNFNRNR